MNCERPAPAHRIRTAGPIVELDGDEMAQTMFALVRDQLVLPHVDIDLHRYDLSLPNRERTGDAVTHEAAAAIAVHRVGIKCSTITPDATRGQEYGLSQLWPSPNGTVRRALNGVIFREPIVVDLARPVPGWRSPIIVARHAHGDQYQATEFAVSTAGRLTLTFSPDDGSAPSVREVGRIPATGGVAMGMYNHTDSIRDFARACFRFALERRLPLHLSTKNTVLKSYDGHFKDVFAEVFTEFESHFAAAGISYDHRLIDDMVASAIKSAGGFVWACKNYDGDVQADIVAQGFGSPGLMTSVLTTPDGRVQLTEAAHGTVARHHRRRATGEVTSTNPVATIFAWTRALEFRARIDGTDDLAGFASALEQAAVATIDAGTMTADLTEFAVDADAARDSPQAVSTEDFVSAVAERITARLE